MCLTARSRQGAARIRMRCRCRPSTWGHAAGSMRFSKPQLCEHPGYSPLVSGLALLLHYQYPHHHLIKILDEHTLHESLSRCHCSITNTLPAMNLDVFNGSEQTRIRTRQNAVPLPSQHMGACGWEHALQQDSAVCISGIPLLSGLALLLHLPVSV